MRLIHVFLHTRTTLEDVGEAGILKGVGLHRLGDQTLVLVFRAQKLMICGSSC